MFSLETSEPTTIFLASGAANPWNVTKSAPNKNINKPLLLFKFGCRDLDVHAMNDLQGGGARSIFQSVWKRSWILDFRALGGDYCCSYFAGYIAGPFVSMP